MFVFNVIVIVNNVLSAEITVLLVKMDIPYHLTKLMDIVEMYALLIHLRILLANAKVVQA